MGFRTDLIELTQLQTDLGPSLDRSCPAPNSVITPVIELVVQNLIYYFRVAKMQKFVLKNLADLVLGRLVLVCGYLDLSVKNLSLTFMSTVWI